MGARVAQHPLQVLPLDVERRQLAPVGQAHPAPAGEVVADLAQRPDGVLHGQVPEDHPFFEHLQQGHSAAHLGVVGVLAHVRVAGDHVQPPVALGVGVGLVAGVDDGAAARRGRGDALPDVLGALCQAEHGAARRLQHLPRAGEDLPGHQEGDQGVQHLLEVPLPGHQVVLVAPVGVARRVGVVLEEVHLAADALLLQAALRRVQQPLQHPLPRLVVGHQLVEAVAFGRGVLGVAAHVEVEAGPVLQEHIRRASPGHHPPEQVAGDLVGRQPPLPVQGAGHPVLVLHPDDAPLHGGQRTRPRRLPAMPARPGYHARRWAPAPPSPSCAWPPCPTRPRPTCAPPCCARRAYRSRLRGRVAGPLPADHRRRWPPPRSGSRGPAGGRPGPPGRGRGARRLRAGARPAAATESPHGGVAALVAGGGLGPAGAGRLGPAGSASSRRRPTRPAVSRRKARRPRVRSTTAASHSFGSKVRELAAWKAATAHCTASPAGPRPGSSA